MNSCRRVILATMLATGTAAADTTIVFRNVDREGSESSRVEIAGNRLRTENPGSGGAYMVFNAESGAFVTVNPADQTYMVFDQETVAQIAEVQRQAIQQMEQQLAAVPEAQRAQMRQMMEQMMGGAMPGGAPKPRRYERSGTQDVAGYECEVLRIYVGDKMTSEQCVADPDDLGMPAADFATVQAMQQFIVDLTSQFAFLSDEIMEYGEPGKTEMPIRYSLNSEMAGKSTGELQSISFDGIDASRFDIPAGYRKQEMPQIGR